MRYRSASDDLERSGRCVELTRAGVIVAVDAPLEKGELVRLELERVGTGAIVHALARVAWTGSAPNAPVTLSMRFVRLSERDEALFGIWREEQRGRSGLLRERRVTQSRPEDRRVRELTDAIRDTLAPPAPGFAEREVPTISDVAPRGSQPESGAHERESSNVPPRGAVEAQLPLPPRLPTGVIASGSLPPPPSAPSAASVAEIRARLARLQQSEKLAEPSASREPAHHGRVSFIPPPPLPLGALLHVDAVPTHAHSRVPAQIAQSVPPAPPPLPSARSAEPASVPPPRPSAPPPNIPPPLPNEPSRRRATLSERIAQAPAHDPYRVEPPTTTHHAYEAIATRAFILGVLTFATLLLVVVGSYWWSRSQAVTPPATPPAQTPAAKTQPVSAAPKLEQAPAPSAAPVNATPVQTAAPAPVQTATPVPTAPVPAAPKQNASAPRSSAPATEPAPSTVAVAKPTASAATTTSTTTTPDAPVPAPAAMPAPAADAPLRIVPVSDDPTRIERAHACLAQGDTACVVSLLEGHARSEAELELWIETLRALGRREEAMREMQRYVVDFPRGRYFKGYSRILSSERAEP